MNIRTILTLISILLFFIPSIAQKKGIEKNLKKTLPLETTNTACDCKDAIEINVTKVAKYGLTKPSHGFGSIQEILSKSKTGKLAFEAEHNTAWYLLNINFDGEFVFEIIPEDSTNDYDFLVYKYTDTGFCKGIQKNAIKPIRSNLSRLDPQKKGITGLVSGAKSEFVGKGIGAAYSKSINVLKGEKYILVLDNVYPDGKGHILNFNYVKQVVISGIVLDADSVPIKSEIILSDNIGNVVHQQNTEKDGKYTINSSMKESLNYTLSFSSANSFIDIKTLNTNDLKNSNAFIDIRTILVRLKKGMKYNMSSINFYGNLAVLLPSSHSSLVALYKLMKENEKMIIRIEGHINLPGGASRNNVFEQTLSEDRAKTVCDYLQNQGIRKERISSIGYSASKMLFPNPKDEAEMSANRRVEINVISIE
ncbi:MAG: OmpA family protein [Bacteroidetes bacterium]|nr:OmpA family protein [Bacteroidota bacterium]